MSQVMLRDSANETPRQAPLRFVRKLAPFVGLFGLACLLPLTDNAYFGLIIGRAAVYWVLVSGLNLVVGFAGQIAIGWGVALLALGAYVTSVLTAGTAFAPVSPYLALAAAGVIGAIASVIIGLPALRLRAFYFAVTTIGFATIVTQIAMAWQSVTGGGIGVVGPTFGGVFSTTWGFYYFCLAAAALCTWLSANIGSSRFGRALLAIRDAEVAAEASGISKPVMLTLIFLFAGAVGGVSGGLFASLQTYITPDAFTIDLSILFFIAILIGGRGSIIGPLFSTVLLTLLPEVAAPLAAWATFLYAALLLAIVLLVPGGFANLFDFKSRKPLETGRIIRPNEEILPGLLSAAKARGPIDIENVVLSFGGVRAIDGLSLAITPGEVHGLIGPNGSGKTTVLNVISGYYRPDSGTVRLHGAALPSGAPQTRAGIGIARTFQNPRIVGEASVLANVMIGGTVLGKSTFIETVLSLGRYRREERELRERAMLALAAVGLERLADVRTDRLQHSELRFLEIARALMLDPAFLLLDEPAAGLAGDEIQLLGALITAISRTGVGVLLIEHHTDLVFDICEQVTVLNLGRTLAKGTPAEIMAHQDVIDAYLGG
jgi:ABC-type branched-subunit amino acid transport system ATPase component/ABC-type branched-subunit amino acid transport system permease subunit